MKKLNISLLVFAALAISTTATAAKKSKKAELLDTAYKNLYEYINAAERYKAQLEEIMKPLRDAEKNLEEAAKERDITYRALAAADLLYHPQSADDWYGPIPQSDSLSEQENRLLARHEDNDMAYHSARRTENDIRSECVREARPVREYLNIIARKIDNTADLIRKLQK